MNFSDSKMDYDFLKKFESNLDMLRSKLVNMDDRTIFFNRFPFHELVNISIIDKEMLPLAIKILDFFTNYFEFYSIDAALHNTMEFILVNLSIVMEDCFEIECILGLFHKIIVNQQSNNLNDYFKHSLERIANILLHVMKTISDTGANSFNRCNLYYDAIIQLLFQTIDAKRSSIDHIISEIFLISKINQAVPVLSKITLTILYQNDTINWDWFSVVYDWINEECVKLVICFQNVSEQDSTLADLLLILCTFCKKIDASVITNLNYQYFYESLLTITDSLCELSSNTVFRLNSLQLIQYALNYFFTKEGMTKTDSLIKQIGQYYDRIPLDVTTWVSYDIDVFFSVYHMVIKFGHQKKIIWKKENLLYAIAKCFYNKRDTIDLATLKSIYYLYPSLIDSELLIDLQFKTLGDDLIIYFVNFCDIPYLYSLVEKQLNWMLLSQNHKIKRGVLLHWMEYSTNEALIISEIKKCRSENDLFQLMLDNGCETKYGIRAALIMRNMASSSLSNEIALMIPLSIEKPQVLYNLLLSEPSVPVCREKALLLCTIMGSLIPMIRDPEALQAACVFSRKIFVTLHADPNSVKEFCRNIDNVRYLLNVAKNALDESTSIEAIKLLNIVINIQKIHSVLFEETIVEDFTNCFVGSRNKITSSLSFFKQIISNKNGLIIPDKNTILLIYHKFLKLVVSLDMSEAVYDCISLLFRMYPWLTTLHVTIVHIEMTCFSKNGILKQYVKMLLQWMKNIKKQTCNGFCYIPETAIRSFIARSSLDAKMAQKLHEMLALLVRKSHI